MISATISSFVTIYLFCLNFSNSLPLFPDDIEYGGGSVAAGGGGGQMTAAAPTTEALERSRKGVVSYICATAIRSSSHCEQQAGTHSTPPSQVTFATRLSPGRVAHHSIYVYVLVELCVGHE